MWGAKTEYLVPVVNQFGDKEYYFIEVPSFCVLKYSDFLLGSNYVKEVNELCNCEWCAHFNGKCLQEYPKLKNKRVNSAETNPITISA